MTFVSERFHVAHYRLLMQKVKLLSILLSPEPL